MIRTEDEARKCWCPFANVNVSYQNIGASGNRGLSKEPSFQDWEGKARCIASECMAWRTGERTIGVGDRQCPECGGRGGPLGIAHGRDCPNCDGTGRIGEITVGYCGLAGEPK